MFQKRDSFQTQLLVVGGGGDRYGYTFFLENCNTLTNKSHKINAEQI